MQYIYLLNYPHVSFWKWNKDKETWQSDVRVSHRSLTLFLTEGSRQIAGERRRLLCVIPPVASMFCSLRNECLQLITERFAASLLSQCAKSAAVMRQAGEQRQRWIHSSTAFTVPRCLKHKIRGRIYRQVARQIWLKEKSLSMSVFNRHTDLVKGVSSSAELSRTSTALKKYKYGCSMLESMCTWECTLTCLL